MSYIPLSGVPFPAFKSFLTTLDYQKHEPVQQPSPWMGKVAPKATDEV